MTARWSMQGRPLFSPGRWGLAAILSPARKIGWRQARLLLHRPVTVSAALEKMRTDGTSYTGRFTAVELVEIRGAGSQASFIPFISRKDRSASKASLLFSSTPARSALRSTMPRPTWNARERAGNQHVTTSKPRDKPLALNVNHNRSGPRNAEVQCSATLRRR